MADSGRLVAPDLNLRPQLQAAPLVNVSMVSPVNRQGAGSNLMRIAESLGSLTNVMQSYASTVGHQQKKAQDTADANFVKSNQWRTPEDITNQPGYNPHSEPQQVLMGQATANSISPQMQDWVKNEWDPEKEPDLYKFLSGKLGALQAELPPAAQAGFGSTIDTSVRETMKWWDGIQSDKQTQAMKQNTFAHFVSLNDLYKDLPPEQRVQKMKEMGLDQYRTLKFTDGKGQNNLLMDAIDEFARRGDKDMVRALSSLRRGAKGEVPSLYDMPDFRDRIDAATAAADASWVKTHQAEVGDLDAKIDEITTKGDINQLTEYFNSPTALKLYPNPAERGEKLRAAAKKLNENLLKNTVDSEKTATITAHQGTAVRNFWLGNGSQQYGEVKVKAKDGKEYTWNGDKEAQDAVDQSIKAEYEKAAGDPEAIAALDKKIARVASNSPLKVSEWEHLFSGALNSSVTNSLLEGKVPPNTKRAYDLWVNTKDTPRARRANMGENAEQTDTFFSLVDTFKTAGYGETEAFVAANEAQPRMGAAIGRVSEELLGQNSSSYEIRSYPMDIQDKITKRAAAYMASGTMGQEKAVTKAIRDFGEETVKIDDFGSRPSFVNVPDKSIDKDTFKTSISSFVTNQVALHGIQQNMPLDIKDVNIFDYGNGRYGLQRDDGEPVPAFFTHRGGTKGNGVMYFTYDDVQRQLQADAAEASGAANAELKDNARKVDDIRSGKPMFESNWKNLDTPGPAILEGIKAGVNWLTSPGKPDKPDTSILKGNTGNVEDAYGAQTGDQLRKLSDQRLADVYALAKKDKLNVSGFVTSKSVIDEYEYRIRASGYSPKQITAAMSRWGVNELEAIKRLKGNNAKPE